MFAAFTEINKQHIFNKNKYAILKIQFNNLININNNNEIDALIDKDILNNNKFIYYVCKFGNTELIKYVINIYPNIDLLTFHNNQSITQLICSYGEPDIIKYIIDNHKIDFEVNDTFGRNVIYYICHYSTKEMVEYIVDIKKCNIKNIIEEFISGYDIINYNKISNYIANYENYNIKYIRNVDIFNNLEINHINIIKNCNIDIIIKSVSCCKYQKNMIDKWFHHQLINKDFVNKYNENNYWIIYPIPNNLIHYIKDLFI